MGEGGDMLVGVDYTSKIDFFSIYVEESIYSVSVHLGVKYMFSSLACLVNIKATSNFSGMT